MPVEAERGKPERVGLLPTRRTGEVEPSREAGGGGTGTAAAKLLLLVFAERGGRREPVADEEEPSPSALASASSPRRLWLGIFAWVLFFSGAEGRRRWWRW